MIIKRPNYPIYIVNLLVRVMMFARTSLPGKIGFRRRVTESVLNLFGVFRVM